MSVIRNPFTLGPARALRHTLPVLAALGAGCATTTEVDEPTPTDSEESGPAVTDSLADCALLDHIDIRNGLVLEQGDVLLGEESDLPRLCAEDRARRTRGVGAAILTKRWDSGVVPVKIHPDLPQKVRVEQAMATWNAATSLHFIEYDPTRDTDYIEVVNGDWCTSPIGRQGHRQPLYLSTLKTPANVRGMAIAGNDWVYTWYSDGMVSAGSSVAADSNRAQYPFDLPPNYVSTSIAEMAIDADDHVYTWYTNGKFSIGTSGDLDAYAAPANYVLPPGKTAAMIRGVGFAGNGTVITWFSDNTMALGIPQNLGVYTGGAAIYYGGPGLANDLVGIDVASNGWIYAWFPNGGNLKRSAGTASNLSAYQPLKTMTLPRDCNADDTVHELGHALGLYHEQSRCDRDDHITVFYNNVDEDRKNNFDVSCVLTIDYDNYDFDSMMHYSSGAFSNNGSPTMLRHPPAGVPIDPAVIPLDAAIASDDHVYTWWSDGKVTAGESYDLEIHRSRYPFTVAPGLAWYHIVGIGIAKNTDRVYAYYANGTYSVGTSNDLDYYEAPKPYLLPNKADGTPYLPADIHSIGIAHDNHVYAWYRDGNVSAGKSDHLGFYRSPRAYQLAAGHTPFNAWGMAITDGDKSYAWYFDGHASNGNTEDLAALNPFYAIRARGLLITAKTAISNGDKSAIDDMY